MLSSHVLWTPIYTFGKSWAHQPSHPREEGQHNSSFGLGIGLRFYGWSRKTWKNG